MKFAKLIRPAVVGLLAFVLCVWPVVAQGTSTSSVSTVTLNYNITESISLTVTGGPINFPSNGPGVVSNGNAITLQPAWNIVTGHTAVDVVGYFSTTNALVSGSQHILASNVWGSETGATSCATSISGFTGTADGQSNSFLFYHNTTPPLSNSGAAENCVVTLTLTANATTGLTAGNFTGTLNIFAQAN